MPRSLWVLLAVTEMLVAFATLVLEWSFLLIAIKVIITALVRWSDVFQPNSAYFMGMFFGCVIRLAPVPLLTWHAVWITRNRITQAAIPN